MSLNSDHVSILPNFWRKFTGSQSLSQTLPISVSPIELYQCRELAKIMPNFYPYDVSVRSLLAQKVFLKCWWNCSHLVHITIPTMFFNRESTTNEPRNITNQCCSYLLFPPPFGSIFLNLSLSSCSGNVFILFEGRFMHFMLSFQLFFLFLWQSC